jgi:hypothetical protein
MPRVSAAQTEAGIDAWATGRKSLGPTRLNGHPRENDTVWSIAFGEHECVIGGIDNSGKRCAARLAIESIAFKAAGIDMRSVAPGERYRRIAARTGDEFRARLMPSSLRAHGLSMTALLTMFVRLKISRRKFYN